MLAAIRSSAELDLLEAEIVEEEKNLQVLKESLERAEGLTRRMIRALEDFDERITHLDPVIMPIFRNVQAASTVQSSNGVFVMGVS